MPNQPNRPVVLFLEDNTDFAANYIARLESSGLKVVHLLDAQKAVDFLRNATVNAMVVDIQLPAPAAIARHEVSDGNTTGLWFLDQVRVQMLEWKIPAFVLTNNLVVHKPALEEFEARDPALPGMMFDMSSKSLCGARQLPPRVWAQVEFFGGGAAGNP